MTHSWLWTPGLYVVDENDLGEQLVLSGPWFSEVDAELERVSWGGCETIAIVGWLHEEAAA